MENSQTASFSNELAATQLLTPEVSGDYIWKALYSHSYTIIFNCEKCNHQFDIDGWFYQFDAFQCPECKTIFNGYFGKVLPSYRSETERSLINVLKLESFDDQEFEIQLSSSTNVFASRKDHIVLVIFSKPKEKNSKPFCWFDYSVKNTKAQYFQPQLAAETNPREKIVKKKSKSMFPFILFGLLSLMGICSLFFVLTPGIQLFK